MTKIIIESGRTRVLTVNDGVSNRDPSFKDECDASKIVERFRRTGELPRRLGPAKAGSYGDVS